MKRYFTYCLILCSILIPQFSYTQAADSLASGKRYPTSKQTWPPLLLITTGAAATLKCPHSIDAQIAKERNEDMVRFKTAADDYLQFLPLIITYSFDALGMRCRTDIQNRTVIALKSQLLTTMVVSSVKYFVNTRRPDGSGNNSFPSGHSATAFTCAAFMSEELGYRYKWVPYVAYTIAGSVGMFRVFNNKHYVSDVLVGAGIGILSTKLIYGTHQYRCGNKKAHPQIL
jgi:membrane-associated phospholipid phosphatase